jgi:hypothetical protein
LIEARDALGPEAQSRLDNTFLQAATIILQTAQHNDALAQLGNPNPVPKKGWKKKKAHGLADAVGLASAEIAHRDLLAKERLKEPQIEQLVTHLGLPMRKILAYYRLYSAPKAGGIWQHEEDAWKDPGLCSVTYGHCKKGKPQGSP